MGKNGSPRIGMELFKGILRQGDPKHPAPIPCSQSDLFSSSNEDFTIWMQKYE